MGLVVVVPRNLWTLRYGSVSKRNYQHSKPACLPGTNDDMGLPGKEVAWNADASWLASKAMGW